MENVNLKERTLKNVSYSLLSFVWPVLIAFVVTPIVVNHYGVKEYGIYLFINTLISLAGLLDIGFASAVSKFIAEKNGRKDKDGIITLFKSANTVFLIIGVVGAIFISLSIYIGLVTFPSDLIASYRMYIPSFFFAGILFCINSINSLHVIIPMAYQRFDIGSKIGIVFITVQQLGILFVIFIQGSINVLFFFQMLLMFIFYFIYKKYVSTIISDDERKALNVYGWDVKEVVSNYKFGVISFINNLAGVSLTYLDRMIIPLFLGPSNLTFYSLPGSITNKVPTLAVTLSSVVFPMTSHFEGSGDKNMVRNLYVRSTRLITIISTAISITFIAFAYALLQYWISTELANKATTVLIILAITNLILAVVTPLNSLLLGMGKLRALITTSTITALINIVLLFVLMPRFGIEGAAYAYLFALVPYIFLIYKTEKGYLDLFNRASYYVHFISKLVVISGIIFVIDKFFVIQYVHSFVSVLLASAVSTTAFLVLYFLFGFFEKEDVVDISHFLKKVFGKIFTTT